MRSFESCSTASSFPDVQLHIVDAPLGAGPESITTIGSMDARASSRPGMTEKKLQHNQQNCPSGKSLACFRAPRVKPRFGKYSAFAVGQISDLNPPVSPDKRGGSRSSRNARWDAVDADVLLTNSTEAYGEVVWS
jgi:hypothetical protein